MWLVFRGRGGSEIDKNRVAMREFTKYINYCDQRFREIARCQNCPYGQCIHDNPAVATDCYSCLSKIHRYVNRDLTYRCEKIIYNYVLKHGHRYASEIDKIMSYFTSNPQLPIGVNVYSVGCGPSTEIFGVINRLPNHVIHYKGFDTNQIWAPLNNCVRTLFPGHDVQFEDVDFFQFMAENDDHIDILIFNYLLSDMARQKDAAFCSTFIDNVVSLCEARRISHIVINDVYLTYGTGTGYALMEELARKLQNKRNITWQGWRGHFATPKQFQPAYGQKCPERLSIPIVEPAVMAYNPFSTCGSLFMLIHIQ